MTFAHGTHLLLKFNVSNFLSFDEEQTFSMEAGKVRSNIERVYTEGGVKALKFMAIYGSNASGKSNLVSAFDFAQMAITRGIPTNAYACYCRLKDENKNRASHFEFTIFLDHKRYIYGFSALISSGCFLTEYLKQVKYGTVCKTIFYRDTSSGLYEVDTYFKDSAINDRLKIYMEDIKNDSSILFLRAMNQNKDSLYKVAPEIGIYKRIFNWVKYRLSINYPDRPITNYSYLMDGDGVEQVGKLLSIFGTGVSELAIADISLDKVTSKISKELMQNIISDLDEQQKKHENKGTDGKVYVIDEINRRFHPLLTYKFVEEYLKLAPERNIQLIVTTHESKLMDLDLLRKDEIEFIDKDEDGKSTIFSLDSFGERFDKKVCRAYLNGAYGAIPKFSSQ